jgi:hypothetical protein
MTRRPFRFLACVLALASAGSASAQSAALEAALAAGKVSGQLNLRYEGVKEDNALDSAEALTLRSALKYSTAGWRGFSAVVEVEDVRSLGIDNYAVPVTGFNSGRYSVIADPETTELNQAYLQYLQGGFTARLGRQDLRYDDQRMIGAVPWRQDYQSFDALSLSYQQDAGRSWSVAYHYLGQRERVFAEAGDIDSKDHILRGVLATPLATLHAFQGWADQFLNTPPEGIEDWYLSIAHALAGGTLSLIYHNYSAAESSPAVSDLGEEFNVQWVRPLRSNYQLGLKYADYRQGDLAAKSDKQICWTWLQLNF